MAQELLLFTRGVRRGEREFGGVRRARGAGGGIHRRRRVVGGVHRESTVAVSEPVDDGISRRCRAGTSRAVENAARTEDDRRRTRRRAMVSR